MISIHKATALDAFYLGYAMREEDRAEVKASGGYTPEAAALRSIQASTEAWAAEWDGEIVACWGVVELNPLTRYGVVWALTGKLVEAHPKLFYKGSKEVVRDLRTRYSLLVNAVDARYARALRWVERLGFEVGESRSYGVEGRPFHPIALKGVQHV